MPDYNEYAQRVINAINTYGETINLKYRVSTWSAKNGEKFTYRTYKNFKVFIRPTDKRDWEQLPEGLRIRDIRKMYLTEELPKKDLIIERLSDGKEYEIVVPPDDNLFGGINFYYKCYIAIKEENRANDID